MPKLTDIIVRCQIEQPILFIPAKVDGFKNITCLFQLSYDKVYAYMQTMNELMTDVPFIVYKDYLSMDERNIDLEMCFPTSIPLQPKGDIQSKVIPKGKIIISYYRGDRHNDTLQLYGDMTQWIADNGYEPEGPAYEYYFNDRNFPAKDQLLKIVIPFKESNSSFS